MHILTGKHIARRTFLRGAGAAVALPFLDAMVPAGRLYARGAADKTRFIAIESVHGAAGSNAIGAAKHLWAPEQVGRNFSFVDDNALRPLDAWRKYLTIVSNT